MNTKPSNWWNLVPFVLSLIIGMVTNHYKKMGAFSFEDWFLVIALQMETVILTVSINIQIILEYRKRRAETAAPARTETPVGYTRIGELAYEQTVKKVDVQETDKRIIQWAYGVTYWNTPMTQSKWCGKGKPFSKPVYVALIYDLLEAGHITIKDWKNPKSSYKPNGAGGRKFIKDLADGRAYIPLPTRHKTETDVQFLREQLRRRSNVGQGRGDD